MRRRVFLPTNQKIRLIAIFSDLWLGGGSQRYSLAARWQQFLFV
jgi:hypothetical protein